MNSYTGRGTKLSKRLYLSALQAEGLNSSERGSGGRPVEISGAQPIRKKAYLRKSKRRGIISLPPGMAWVLPQNSWADTWKEMYVEHVIDSLRYFNQPPYEPVTLPDRALSKWASDSMLYGTAALKVAWGFEKSITGVWVDEAVPTPAVKECECGKEKHGFASHSTWCPKHE